MAPRTRQGEDGFTLVELLIVMLIITILATIAIPLFLNQREKAQDAAAKSGARLVAQTLHVFEQDNNTFAGADRDALEQIEPEIATIGGLTIDAAAGRFEVSVASVSGDDGGGPFVIEYDAGQTERTCLQPGDGGCPIGGRW